MGREIIAKGNTRIFAADVAGELPPGKEKIHLLLGSEGEGEILYEKLGLQVTEKDGEYYLAVVRTGYDRQEYEKFVELAREEGVSLSGTTWMSLQLTFPLEFWSLTKQKSISEKVNRQQFRLLAKIFTKLRKGEINE